jgi:hypothetical protein
MNGVIPAWRLAALMRNNPWVPLIKKQEEELATQEASGPDTVLDAADQDKNPKHREDFTALLNAAVRKPKKDDET